MTAISTVKPDQVRAEPVALPQQRATVTAVRDGGFALEINGAAAFARVALSCLVQPEPGDAVAALEADGLWITAILARASGAPLRLLAGQSAVIGGAGGTLDVRFGEVTVSAGKAEFFIDQVLHVGRSVTAHLASLRRVVGLIETIAERVHLTARSSHRSLEESDHLKARTIDHAATDSLRLQADCALITGGTAIRMDAGQIHMG